VSKRADEEQNILSTDNDHSQVRLICLAPHTSAHRRNDVGFWHHTNTKLLWKGGKQLENGSLHPYHLFSPRCLVALSTGACGLSVCRISRINVFVICGNS